MEIQAIPVSWNIVQCPKLGADSVLGSGASRTARCPMGCLDRTTTDCGCGSLKHLMALHNSMSHVTEMLNDW